MNPSARSRLAARWAAVALLAASSRAAAQDVTILQYETVPSFGAAAAAAGTAPGSSGKPQAAAVPTWSFVAYGRHFDVELEPNERLMLGLAPERRARLRDVELYAGRLTGMPDSWVRIARHRGIVSGVIWDGATLYAVETERRIARFAVNPSAGGGDVAVYRIADTLGVLRDEVIRPSGDAPEASDAERPAAITKPLPTPVGLGARLDLAVVADELFIAREGEFAEAALLSILNIVDGIYVMQIGIHLGLADLVLLDSPGPFTSNDARTLLSQLEEYKASNPTFRASGLAHLFTGRNLDEQQGSSGQLVGVANVGAICSARFGAGLTQATFPMLSNALIAAHEIGHNFGAPHDGEEGSPCAHEPPDFLMATSVNGSREFSQCSIEKIAAKLQNAACLMPLPPTDVAIRIVQEPPPEVRLDNPFPVVFEISNEGPATAHGIEITVAYDGLSPPNVSQSNGAPLLERCVETQPAYCPLPDLAPGEVVEYGFLFDAWESGSHSIDITVTALNDADTSNNYATVTVQVRPEVDLAAEMSIAEIVVYPDEPVRLSGVVKNVGTVDASSVIAEFFVPWQYDIDDVDSGGTECVLVAVSFVTRYQCRIGALAAGAVWPISWTATPKPEHLDVLATVGASLAVWSSYVETRTASDNRAWTNLVRTDAKGDVAMLIEGATSFRSGDPIELVVRFENRGPDEARELMVYNGPGSSYGMPIDSVSSSVGDCNFIVRSSRFDCRAERLAAGESLTITLRGTAEFAGDYRLDVVGVSSADPNPQNNSASHAFRVVEPASGGQIPSGSDGGGGSGSGGSGTSGGGGGGGALGFGALLGLLGAAAARHRRLAQAAVALAATFGAVLAAPIAAAQGSGHGRDDARGREPSGQSAPRAESRPGAAVDLPDGDGKALVQTACLVCHDLGGIAAFKGYWNREQWAAMVATMIEHGAVLDPAEAEIVIDYLTAHFGVGHDRGVEQDQQEERGTAE